MKAFNIKEPLKKGVWNFLEQIYDKSLSSERAFNCFFIFISELHWRISNKMH